MDVDSHALHGLAFLNAVRLQLIGVKELHAHALLGDKNRWDHIQMRTRLAIF